METEKEEIPSPAQSANSPSSLESFLDNNWKLLLFALCAGIILMGGYFFYDASNDEKAIKRGEELISVSMTDSSISDLEKFATANENTVSGNNALLIIAEKYTNSATPNIEKAKEYLEKFIQQTDQENPFYYEAKFSLGTLNEKNGNTEKAQILYDEVVQSNSNSKAAATIRLADMLVKNKEFDKAKAEYESITNASKGYINNILNVKIPDTIEAKERSLSPPPPLEPEETKPKAEEPAPEPKAEEPAPKPKAEEPAPEPKAEEPAPEPKVEEN
jgi:predicted negative regulator of RcsB-dependent stress response